MGDVPADTRDAYDTLYTVLVTVSRVFAPLLPFITEEIHSTLVGGESVHLEDWPDAEQFPADEELVAHMDRARDVVTATLNLREDAGLRTRLPLASLTIAGAGSSALEDEVLALVADEVNVKRIEVTEEVGGFGEFVLKPNGRAIGPRLGGDTQTVMGAARAGEWTDNGDGTVTVAGHVLSGDDYELALQVADGVTARGLRTNDAVVSLDTDVTPELAAEGLARDLVREVQAARRDAGFDVSDRIVLTLHADDDLRTRLAPHESYVADQVLATEVVWADEPQPVTATLADGHSATVAVARVD